MRNRWSAIHSYTHRIKHFESSAEVSLHPEIIDCAHAYRIRMRIYMYIYIYIYISCIDL